MNPVDTGTGERGQWTNYEVKSLLLFVCLFEYTM